MTMTILTVILVHNHPKLGFGLIPAALLLAYSRMYLYLHFPSDVLAGIILGLAIGFLTIKLTPTVEKKIELRKEKRKFVPSEKQD